MLLKLIGFYEWYGKESSQDEFLPAEKDNQNLSFPSLSFALVRFIYKSIHVDAKTCPGIHPYGLKVQKRNAQNHDICQFKN